MEPHIWLFLRLFCNCCLRKYSYLVIFTWLKLYLITPFKWNIQLVKVLYLTLIGTAATFGLLPWPVWRADTGYLWYIWMVCMLCESCNYNDNHSLDNVVTTLSIHIPYSQSCIYTTSHYYIYYVCIVCNITYIWDLSCFVQQGIFRNSSSLSGSELV